MDRLSLWDAPTGAPVTHPTPGGGGVSALKSPIARKNLHTSGHQLQGLSQNEEALVDQTWFSQKLANDISAFDRAYISAACHRLQRLGEQGGGQAGAAGVCFA